MKLNKQEIRKIYEAAQLITSLRAGDIVITTNVYHGRRDPENEDALTAAQGQAEYILNTIDAAVEHDFYDSGIQFAKVIHATDYDTENSEPTLSDLFKQAIDDLHTIDAGGTLQIDGHDLPTSQAIREVLISKLKRIANTYEGIEKEQETADDE